VGYATFGDAEIPPESQDHGEGILRLSVVEAVNQTSCPFGARAEKIVEFDELLSLDFFKQMPIN
jgi:hypothetical protein